MFAKVQPGKEPKRPSGWSNEPLKGGGVMRGWLAGDPVWVWLHKLRYSKPCRLRITDGKLSCPLCGGPKPTELRAYVPIYREDGKQVFVIIPEYNADGLAGVQLHHAVKAFRGRETADPIRVVRDKTTPDYKPPHPGRKDKVDIEPSLLRIWGDDELTRFFGLNPAEEKTAPETTEPAEQPAEKPQSRIDPDTLKRYQEWVRGNSEVTRAAEPPTVGDCLPPVPAPSANGKHRKK